MLDFFIPPADAVDTKADSRRKSPLALQAPNCGPRQAGNAGYIGCSEYVHEHRSDCMMVHAIAGVIQVRVEELAAYSVHPRRALGHLIFLINVPVELVGTDLALSLNSRLQQAQAFRKLFRFVARHTPPLFRINLGAALQKIPAQHLMGKTSNPKHVSTKIEIENGENVVLSPIAQMINRDLHIC
jgi:endonuclease/exonuclease/phosphatase family metal-dependent hydrolase